MKPEQIQELISLAKQARERAYAPYSGYRVGAAIVSESGAVYTGCNVENLSFGATICAERNAAGAMVASGETRFRLVVVATKDGAAPCGICRQFLAEFAMDDAKVLSVDESGAVREWSFKDLLPETFDSTEVRRDANR